jgi:DNA polymerase-3 subunit epsilon
VAQLAANEIEDIAVVLEEHPDYRVIRRLDVSLEWPALDVDAVSRAVVLDTETTGMDPAADRVIELALVKFEYSKESGEIGRVLDVYDGLEDPGFPIPPESTAIHGITDEMVAGQRVDDAAIERLMDGVGVVIAHNAAFDRPFVERRWPRFAGMPWACSLREVPWEAMGIGSAKLEYLAYRYGFFFDAHRAEIDCRALLEVLRLPPPGSADGDPTAFQRLLESAREPSVRVRATGSPFETKDLLKARGYRWSGDDRVWYLDAGQLQVPAELAWLKEQVYGGKSASIEIESFDARSRYSGRPGKRERVTV